MSVTWHVDDLKISHMESNKISAPHKVLKIGMIKYIKKNHKELPEEIKSAAATPAAEHLFEVCEDNKDKFLPEEQALTFHRTAAQLLLAS
eukprot:14356986-Ditylum_brightwellii.AAC.1